MASYRFCRTDDVALLVDALNRCWSPYFPDEPAMTPATFKRSIRDLQVWCSSCMVAFAGSDPIGVLIGAKRPSGTLVHKIAVHPDHRRQGHGRHLLASLGSKLAILGPPRIIAEVPETLAPACALFGAGGYIQETLLTDYVFSSPEDFVPRTPLHARSRGPHAPLRSREEDDARAVTGAPQAGGAKPPGPEMSGFVIPVTIDDLAANGLLEEARPEVCWERSVETLTARKNDIAGLAVVSDDRIEAYLLYVKPGVGPEENAGNAEAGPRASPPPAAIVSLRPLIEDGGARLEHLLSRLRAQGMMTLRFPKVHPAEIPKEFLETLGFRPAGGHLLYAARARAE